ncbi:hypothetical protein RDI58_012849 [Solanum bulbocastanum]|uniref:DUF4283 domain-containing protein n=1 Tax=Solanum bulbocastanum TaxID=147425 RepID=A0AAN8TJP7_SOLBU
MAEEYRLTIVGRFLKVRSQIDRIRSTFKELIPTRGSVKIGVYDNHNMFLDFTNDDDFNLVWFKRVIEMEGLQMWLQKWTPHFKPKGDIPIAPVWLLLPGFPFHMHSWHYVKQIVSSIGTPLAMDVVMNGRTRPSMAKVRVGIDLLKSHPENVWIGLEDEESPLRGYYQKLEYENIPKYCKHCRKLGHKVMNCQVLEKIRSNEAKEEKDKKKKSVNITQGGVDANRGKQKQNENNQRMERNSGGNETKNNNKGNHNLQDKHQKRKKQRQNKQDHEKEEETGKQQTPESENERQPDGHTEAENNNNQLNYNGTKQKNPMSPNSSEEKVENTYRNEELVEKEQPRIKFISKSTSLPTKIKNQEPLQLAVELNNEQVVDQP